MKSIYESRYIRQNMDYNYKFPIALAPNGIPFGAKSNGKCNFIQ